MKRLALLLTIFICALSNAQFAPGLKLIDGIAPNGSFKMLDAKWLNNGFQFSSDTTSRNNIPANLRGTVGTAVFCMDVHKMYYLDSIVGKPNNWVEFSNSLNVVHLTDNETIDSTKTFLKDIKIASNNISVGNGNTAASLNNLVFGRTYYLKNTTGSRNIAIGRDVLDSNTTGSFNVALGDQAMYYNTTGGSNNAFGLAALQSNTTGSFNSAFGQSSLLKNTTGSNNNAMGVSSLEQITSGDNNQAFGSTALRHITTGSNNAAMGRAAGEQLVTGNNNIFVGFDAGVGTVGGTTLLNGNNNVIISSGIGVKQSTIDSQFVVNDWIYGDSKHSIFFNYDSTITRGLDVYLTDLSSIYTSRSKVDSAFVGKVLRNGYVPYSGATAALQMGTFAINSHSYFNTPAFSTNIGTTDANDFNVSTNSTLRLKIDATGASSFSGTTAFNNKISQSYTYTAGANNDQVNNIVHTINSRATASDGVAGNRFNSTVNINSTAIKAVGSEVTLNYIVVSGLQGGLPLTNPGTGYVPGTYTNVPLVGNTGSGALATIVVNASGGVATCTITTPGSGYGLNLGSLSTPNTNLGGSGSGFQASTASAGSFSLTIDQSNSSVISARLNNVFAQAGNQNLFYGMFSTGGTFYGGLGTSSVTNTAQTTLFDMNGVALYSSSAGTVFMRGLTANGTNTFSGSNTFGNLTIGSAATIPTLNVSSSINITNNYLSLTGSPLATNGYLMKVTTPNVFSSGSSALSVGYMNLNTSFVTGQIATDSISNPGSGYTDGTYTVATTGGTGSFASATSPFTVTVLGGVITAAVPANTTYGYTVGDVLTFASFSGTGSGGQITVKTVNTSASNYYLVNATGGFADKISATSYTMFNMAPTINQSGTASGTIRGAYWNPTVTALVSGKEIPFENVRGTNYFNSSAGNTAFGVSSGTAISDKVTINGNLNLLTAGNKIKIATGTNASTGSATLSGGTVTVTNTNVTASSNIFLTVETPGGTQGILSYTKSAGSSFTITSTSATESSIIKYIIIN